METLPDALLLEILKRFDKTSDRNVFSIVCKRLCEIEAEQRNFLKVGCGLNPANEALTSLCIRFPNLTTIEIVYSGWMSNMGKQLNNEALLVLSSHCPKLVDLTLSFCSFINDRGISNLAFCKTLKALKLNFIPGISSNGLLSIASGCKNLSTLHLNRCMKVNSVEWIEYFGTHGNLESLSIKNCKGVGQNDIIQLGPGWKKLKQFEFDLDVNYQYRLLYTHQEMLEMICCDNMKELSLLNCSLGPGRALNYILTRCASLESLSLNMCNCIDNFTMTKLAQKSHNLKKISLHLSTDFSVSAYDDPFRFTDEGLLNLAHGCFMLEEFALSFTEEFPTFACFTQSALLSLIQSCPIRVLILKNVIFLNDDGMDALSSAKFLQLLEIVKCQDLTDDGIKLVMNFPSLKRLKLSKCLGVSDVGIKPLVDSEKLDSLIIEDCFQISEKGVQGAAKFVSYRQDFEWTH